MRVQGRDVTVLAMWQRVEAPCFAAVDVCECVDRAAGGLVGRWVHNTWRRRYKKYLMLKKMHLPLAQIKMRMARDHPDLDPSVLDS